MYLAEQPFGDPAASAIEAASERRRVCFFFNAQLHQMLHAMPTAIELSRDPRFEVHVLAATPRHIELAGQLVRAAGCGPIRCDLVGGGALQRIAALRATSIPPKLVTLALAARRLARFDAVVVPERTSLLLRRLGLRHVRFVHTTHGAGDRAVGFERRIRQFDFVLLAGEKQRRRMLAEGVIREGGYAVVGYQKLDAVKLIATPGGAAPIFPNGRPTVLYNPHCSRALSSWRTMGKAIVDQFAADERYNLIVAPHVKLFDCRAMRAEAARLRSRYVHCPNIHIDLGSTRSLDMSYTRVADLYLGDVSSQVSSSWSGRAPACSSTHTTPIGRATRTIRIGATGRWYRTRPRSWMRSIRLARRTTAMWRRSPADCRTRST